MKCCEARMFVFNRMTLYMMSQQKRKCYVRICPKSLCQRHGPIQPSEGEEPNYL